MFNKILIANRGEIACRIIRTAQRMGIRTVSVYSEADAAARHVAMADAAVEIGPAPARESYLVADRIINAAKSTGAEAIHPGYGFLSENANFARTCAGNDIIFIGPPARAIEAMGSKSAAKTIMEQAKVPLVPGYHGADQDPELLRREAKMIGFPVLIKASAGGGGKGMRVVDEDGEFPAALETARREALNAFADDTVLLEKYLLKPRHIEIQVFFDQAGNGVYLFERDCSVQRRHQKILEEAPAPGMDEKRRQEMGAAALKAAAAIGYQGAGTVEFIVDAAGAFYFMEMNTRLQVEHPVTELITGQDLVEWQLRVAAGEDLPLKQTDLGIYGHALEARIYAEDPDNDFLPCTGHLSHLRFPSDSRHIRVDTGVREGDTVSIYYDPMIAKLIVWDADRKNCLRRMQAALEQTQVAGLTTNLDFLNSVVSHPAFRAAEVDTGFIPRHELDLFPDTGEINRNILSLAVLYVLLERAQTAAQQARQSAEPGSPWHLTDSWQMNLASTEQVRLSDGGREHDVLVEKKGGGYDLLYAGESLTVSGMLLTDNQLQAKLGQTRIRITVIRHGNLLTLFHAGNSYELELRTEEHDVATEDSTGKLVAPMPGKVITVLTEKGKQVSKGDPLLILEAMKMEHTITAPADGMVADIFFSKNEMVDEGVELVRIE